MFSIDVYRYLAHLTIEPRTPRSSSAAQPSREAPRHQTRLGMGPLTTLENAPMPTPKNSDPVAWAEYNARLAGMTAEEYEEEFQACKTDPRAHAESVLSENLPWLSPSGELACEVLRLVDEMESQALSILGDPYTNHSHGRRLLCESELARAMLVCE